ncbi:MAG: hypothetical protein H6838_02905 [Planctomycetes bacterium]|nr:hypothetical protein [Planctomycetota bacterium]
MIKVDLNPSARMLGQFAYVAVVGLPLLGGLILRMAGAFAWDHPVLLACAAVGVAQLVLFLVGVRVVTKGLYLLLTVLAAPIGFVLSHVMMATIYYLVMTPIGLFFRLIGRDAIGRKIDPSLPTYWHDRGRPRPASSYFKLY